MMEPGQEPIDGARIAVILQMQRRRQVIVGHAHSTDDDDLGRVVRIDMGDPDSSTSQEGSPSLLIPRHHWDTHSRRDTEYGCDYSLELTAEAIANTS